MAGENAAIVRRVLGALVSNPYSGLYASLIGGDTSYVVGEGYVNLLHQVDLYTEFLARWPVRLLIADEIGLGKTVEALRFVKYAVRVLGLERVLVVVPANLLVQWREEDASGLGVPMRVIDKRSIGVLWDEYALTGSLGPGVYIGSMDTLKLDKSRAGSPYYELVSGVKWDAVIVDEAHKLGVTGGRGSLRYERIGGLCRKAKHCLLLTATPTRGDLVDLLHRLSVIEPLLNVRSASRRLDPGRSESVEGVRLLRRYLIVRRDKKILRVMEGDERFRVPDAVFLLGVVALDSEEQSFYEEVYGLAGQLLRELGSGPELGLMRALLVKRALSSPLGFLTTLRRLLSRPSETSRHAEKMVKYLLFDEAVELYQDFLEEPDRPETSVLAGLTMKLSPGIRRRVEELAETAAALLGRGDSAVRALAGILARAASGVPLIDGEEDTVYPNILVFTEYKDTLHYIRDSLGTLLPSMGYRALDANNSAFMAYNLSGGRLPPEKLRGSVEAFSGRNGVLLIYYLSSDNSHLIPVVVETVRRTSGRPGISVVAVSTDVAGEGLNLQGANVLINYEVTWSMVRREQRVGRVWRIGQRRKVFVVDLIRGTRLDRMIYERLLSKIYMLSLATGSPLATGPSGVALVRAVRSPEAHVLTVVRPPDVSSGRILEDVSRAMERLEDGLEAFDSELDRIARTIMSRIERYRGLASILTADKPEEEKRRAIQASRTLYGASSHAEAEKALTRLARSCGIEASGGLGRLLVALDSKCRHGWEGPLHLVSWASGEWEIAVLAIAGLTRGDKKIIDMLVLVEAGSNGVVNVYHGFRAIERLSDHLSGSTGIGDAMISSVPSIELLRRSGVLGFLDDAVDSVLGRAINALNSRLQQSVLRPGERLYRMGVLSGRPSSMGVRGGGYDVVAVFYRGSPETGNNTATTDKEAVEEAGIRVVARLFADKGYRVRDVHREGLPYDLVATPKSSLFEEDSLLVEVKSHRGVCLSGILTSNEVRTAEKDPSRYIVCVVALAMTESPLVVCKPYSEWRKTPLTTRRVEDRVVVHI